MTYKDLKNKIKEEQKTLALKIRRGKFLRKPDNRKDVTEEDKELYYYRGFFENFKVELLGEDYRHRHIIYCNMFNNTPYERIEFPRDENLPNTHILDRIRKEWENELDEALRDSA
jgi:hypothetical protein